jgi:hypothetical protein
MLIFGMIGNTIGRSPARGISGKKISLTMLIIREMGDYYISVTGGSYLSL